ncbi:hypothetical protein TPHV1_10322 [Treponema phagedenis]|uniref:Uncharacterized protein n=1 Tax=Treponema phagedenis TaxID=162 RepID=A0A0B7GPZ4_TREPH|nr:hypothetical protein TPHV1_10322 [Treponema phagedenis]
MDISHPYVWTLCPHNGRLDADLSIPMVNLLTVVKLRTATDGKTQNGHGRPWFQTEATF